MKKQQIFTEEHDGFIGAYYGGPADSKKAIILMLGDSSEDHRGMKTITGDNQG